MYKKKCSKNANVHDKFCQFSDVWNGFYTWKIANLVFISGSK